MMAESRVPRFIWGRHLPKVLFNPFDFGVCPFSAINLPLSSAKRGWIRVLHTITRSWKFCSSEKNTKNGLPVVLFGPTSIVWKKVYLSANTRRGLAYFLLVTTDWWTIYLCYVLFSEQSVLSDCYNILPGHFCFRRMNTKDVRSKGGRLQKKAKSLFFRLFGTFPKSTKILHVCDARLCG